MAANDIDDEVVRQLIGDVGDAAPGLIGCFVTETEARIARMELAATSGDLAALGLDAHSLKGAALTYGLARLADIALSLEQACRDGERAAVARFSARIPEAAKAGISALQAFVEENSHRPRSAGP